MVKNQKGFTLVEVIVVAVIVAVLAAVAIPLYNGYIFDSRTNVCENTAASIASAFTAAVQQDATFDGTVQSGAVQVTVPSQAGGPANTLDIPADYTSVIDATTVTVTGPGGTTSTAIRYKN